MRIISKFRDYYDSIAGQKGIDDSIVFVRETQDKFLPDFESKYSWDIKSSKNYFPNYENRGMHNDKSGLVSYESYIIGVCGKVYPLLIKQVQHRRDPNSYANPTRVNEYVFDIDEIEELYNAYEKYSWTASSFGLYKNYLTDKRVTDLFLTHNTPIFVLRRRTNINDLYNFRINPVLNDLKFFKQMDPFTIFQELEMFVGQQLCTEKDTSNIPDKYKIIGHGFDYKHSFRKDPTKKK